MTGRRVWTVIAAGVVALLVSTAAAGAVAGSGVRIAKHGEGAYIGGSMGDYLAAVLAKSTTRLEISMHAWTTCYPTYETLNGKAVKLTPAQQQSFSYGYGWNIPIPNVVLSPSGSFHKTETLPGSSGSHPTITGRISGRHASGTFSATGIRSSGNRCDDVSLRWKATFDASASPDPTLFQP